MTFRDRQRFNMLTRLRAFGATHGQLFPENSTAHAAIATIAAEVSRLEALDVSERSASQSARAARKESAHRALTDTLIRAGSTARVVAKTNGKLDAHVELPLPNDPVGLLTLARQFVAAAMPYADAFAGHGIPIPQIEAHIAAFEQAQHERGMFRDERVKVRAEMTAAFARAMDAVAALEVNVLNTLGNDPVALAVWKQDRRLTGATRSRSSVATPANGATVPTGEPASPALATPVDLTPPAVSASA